MTPPAAGTGTIADGAMPPEPWTIDRALASAQAGGLDRLDAQLLLLHVLDKEPEGRAWLIAHGTDPLAAADAERFRTLARQRSDGAPLAYLTGYREFYGLGLRVDARVLDPRPDTETLVDWALALVPANAASDIIDLGTGSGAIALALAAQRPAAQVWATDASADALDVARANADRLRIPIRFAHGNWFAAVPSQRFDLIASNPPYIAAADPHLPALAREPRGALVSGTDGLRDLRAICAGAPKHLRPGGWLLVEHGWDQAERVRALLERAGFTHLCSRRDLAGIERCSGGMLPAPGPTAR